MLIDLPQLKHQSCLPSMNCSLNSRILEARFCSVSPHHIQLIKTFDSLVFRFSLLLAARAIVILKAYMADFFHLQNIYLCLYCETGIISVCGFLFNFGVLLLCMFFIPLVTLVYC